MYIYCTYTHIFCTKTLKKTNTVVKDAKQKKTETKTNNNINTNHKTLIIASSLNS